MTKAKNVGSQSITKAKKLRIVNDLDSLANQAAGIKAGAMKYDAGGTIRVNGSIKSTSSHQTPVRE